MVQTTPRPLAPAVPSETPPGAPPADATLARPAGRRRRRDPLPYVLIAPAVVLELLVHVGPMLLGGLVQGLIGPGPALMLVHAAAGAAFLIFWAAGLRAFVRRGRG